MIRILLFLSLAAVALAGAPERYDLLVQRNIFAPDRRAVTAALPPAVPAPEPAEVAPAARLTLVGVAILNGVAHAVFAGSAEAFDGPFQTGDRLGPWEVRAIDTQRVTLVADDHSLELPVGGSLEQRGDAWALTEGTVAAPPAAEPTTEPAEDAGMTILERLRQRRQQELGK